ncbi:MAG: glycoside hydrolase family 3 C-terminal domain-containing protein [Blautia sp.]|nr:glycoside hydrolase family 3 C-terminal domain-containing protein [Blautia sp.]
MSEFAFSMEEYQSCARRAAAEGCVLIKNENQTLPLRQGDKVAVFGRMAFHYYKSGLGSGGLVNARYVVGILDALREESGITVDESVLKVYEDWIAGHPYDEGAGWGRVPWSQEEMPVSDALIAQAAENDVALVVIGRTAGEDQDNAALPGQYLLTDTEKELIAKVSAAFPRTAVLLNVGNIIDMKWVGELNVPGVLYVWQGGQEGGNGVCDVLTGRVNPCGKLTDTIAEDIADYPSTAYFGDSKKNYYKEDIYVGYRYFETFAKERVLYPFGFGLSYTDFLVEQESFSPGADKKTLELRIGVKNTGEVAGSEVVQIYIEAPQGAFGKPARVLADYCKTPVLAPGESVSVSREIPVSRFASYDDSGAAGHKNCFVLEAGAYGLYIGTDVRSAGKTAEFELEAAVVEELHEACAPAEEFTRMRPSADGLAYEAVPVREFAPYERMEEPEEIPYTGDRGYRLSDVYDGKVSMSDFIAQLSKEDLVCLFRGEGMCSPKVTPGTASAFGGLTESLRGFGIPAGCCTDGPSGLRLDVGTKAFSLPNGTCLGCTFNDALVEELYRFTGKELRRNRVDALLGPGLNIHRNPLNGRNFEYISEDPLLTGRMGAAQIRGLNVVGCTGTIKHYATNNQEKNRRKVDAVVSQRALREIYLKGYEITVKEGKARAVMTTYGPLNGLWTAGSYELNTMILRDEWGFDGIVMTDWWAEANYENEDSGMRTHAPMVIAGNDLYMVSPDAADQEQDDVMEALLAGRVTVAQLQRNAAHILGFILKSPAMLYEMGRITEEELAERKQAGDDEIDYDNITYYTLDENEQIEVSGEGWDTKAGSSAVFGIIVAQMAAYDLEITVRSGLGELAQLPVSVFCDGIIKETFSFRGSEGKSVTEKRNFGGLIGPNHYIKLYFGATGLTVERFALKLRERLEKPVFIAETDE